MTGVEPRPPSTQPASHLPEFHHTIRGRGVDERDDARSCTSDVELREMSVAFPRVPLSQFESPAHSPRKSLPEESQQPEGAIPGRLSSPGLAEPDHNRTPQNRPGPPMLTIADVPLAVVRDLILALPSNKTAIESLELICAAHELNPLITESVMQSARENLPPVCENKGTCLTITVNPSLRCVLHHTNQTKTAHMSLWRLLIPCTPLL